VSTSRPIATALESWPVPHLAGLIRHGLDTKKVAALVASLREGNALPAIFVLDDRPRQAILDGHHRVAAWAAAGVQNAEVIVLRPR
jgi:ParB-like chromosome segregation protein Spo0J